MAKPRLLPKKPRETNSMETSPTQQHIPNTSLHRYHITAQFPQTITILNNLTFLLFSSTQMPSTHTATTTKIHITALDAIVYVNSLFTLALFLGLSWNTSTSTTLINNQSCFPTSATASDLVTFHIYSFSSFLFSSLIAVAMKQAIKAHAVTDGNSDEKNNIRECNFRGTDSQLGHVNLLALSVGILVSGFGSVLGCGFLTVALVDLVQIKLGTIGCGRWYNIAAVGPLVTLVPSALVFNVVLILFAFSR